MSRKKNVPFSRLSFLTWIILFSQLGHIFFSNTCTENLPLLLLLSPSFTPPPLYLPCSLLKLHCLMYVWWLLTEFRVDATDGKEESPERERDTADCEVLLQEHLGKPVELASWNVICQTCSNEKRKKKSPSTIYIRIFHRGRDNFMVALGHMLRQHT